MIYTEPTIARYGQKCASAKVTRTKNKCTAQRRHDSEKTIKMAMNGSRRRSRRQRRSGEKTRDIIQNKRDDHIRGLKQKRMLAEQRGVHNKQSNKRSDDGYENDKTVHDSDSSDAVSSEIIIDGCAATIKEGNKLLE